MTEKRFELNCGCNGVEDMITGEEYDIGDCCEKMNEQELRIDELEKENIELKAVNSRQKLLLDTMKGDV